MTPIDSVCSTAEESKAKSQRWSSTKHHHHQQQQQYALIPEVIFLPHNTPVGLSYMCVPPWHPSYFRAEGNLDNTLDQSPRISLKLLLMDFLLS